MTKLTSVQVAAEAIANDPANYDAETIAAVRAESIAFGVPGWIIDLLPEPSGDPVAESQEV